jgi:hypothetical protein
MLFDHFQLTMIYASIFLMTLCLPNWWALGGAALVGLIIVALALSTKGSSAGTMFGLLIIMVGVIGQISGTLVRAISLVFMPPSKFPFRFAALSAVGFLLPPFVAAGPTASSAWLKRPSMQACIASSFRFNMAGNVLRIPGLPLFAIEDGKSAAHSSNHITYFGSDNSFKDFCGATDRTGVNHRAIILHIIPSRLTEPWNDRWYKDNCRGSAEASKNVYCQMVDRTQPGGGIVYAKIYAPDMATKAESTSQRTSIEPKLHDLLMLEIPLRSPLAQNSKRPSFDIYPDGLRIWRDVASDSNSRPFVVLCERPQNSDGKSKLSCAAKTPIDGNISGWFAFRTDEEMFSQDANALQTYLRQLAAEMEIREQDNN